MRLTQRPMKATAAFLFHTSIQNLFSSPCRCVSSSPGELSGVGSCHKEEVAALHKSITALDQEKDSLQDEVDLKTERLVTLQEELARKVAVSLQSQSSSCSSRLVPPVSCPPLYSGRTGEDPGGSQTHSHQHGQLTQVSESDPSRGQKE